MSQTRRTLLGAAAIFVAIAPRVTAQTIEHPVVSLGPISFSAVYNGGIAAFMVPNANFGAGSFDARQAANGGADYAATRVNTSVWAEAYIKPELHAQWRLGGEEGSLYAVVSFVAGATIGDGDADLNDVTPGNPGSIAVEEAYVGYTRALPGTSGGDTLALIFGRQNFSIDDGFLLYIGTLNTGQRAGYYLVPRTAFDGWGTIRINADPVRGDIFVLRSTSDKHVLRNYPADEPRTAIVGFDTTLFETRPAAGADGSVTYLDRLRYLTATYFHVYSAQLGATSLGGDGVTLVPAFDRQDMDVFSASTGGKPLYGLGIPYANEFSFYGQAVFERRGEGSTLQYGIPGSKINAYAFYAESGYDLTSLPWSPHVYYRYSRFSGSRDPNGARTGYDPLFYGAPGQRQVYGTYYYGEIVGQYVQANTNEHIHQIGVQFSPPFHVFSHGDSSKIDLIAYDFNYDKLPAGITGRHIATEVDVAWEYQYDPSLFASLVGGFATPGKGITQTNQQAVAAAGVDPTGLHFSKTTFLVEAYLTKNF